MSRRRFVALVSASVILVLVLVAAGVVLAITRTDFGRERIRELLAVEGGRGLHNRGTMYVGRISGSVFTEVSVDSFALRDAEDSLFVATGPIRVTFDPRDLVGQRLHFKTVEIERANVYLRRHANDVWNYRMIFPEQKKGVLSHTQGLGDYIVADSVTLRDATFTLTEPWQPDDSLHGARRDSAVRVALARPLPEVRLTKEGLKRTRRWTHLELRSPRALIAHPHIAGQTIAIGSMAVVESDPPTALRNLHGSVHIHGDSVWVKLSHFDLPATTGEAVARVWWGGNKPLQMDVRAVADSVSLRDFWWIYPNLPRVGGGRTEVHVHNDPRNLKALDFALKNLDVRTMRSHLRGDMTFATGWPVLVLKDVAMSLEPADFDLLRAFNGGPLGVDWQGRIAGTVHAAGGRIDRWRVDSADLTFRDAHVEGATSRVLGRGEIDLLTPSLARFHAFATQFAPLDLRTVEFLFPNFPRLGGTVTGSATLDSIWTDVRFHDADAMFHDGPDPPSRVTGDGRITAGDRFMTFDVSLEATPLSFTTLARSYPDLPLRGAMSGPLRVQGTMDHLAVSARLRGDAGGIAADEVIDLEPAGGVGARGTARAEGLELAQLFGRASVPATRLYASLSNDLHGDSLATMRGAVDLTVDTSQVADIWVPRASARMTLADGHLRVDSLLLLSTGVRVHATGMLGVAAGVRDTLRFSAEVDSLGGLRSLFDGNRPRQVADTAPAGAASATPARARRDSLDGTLVLTGALGGSMTDSLTAHGTIVGQRIVFGTGGAERLTGSFDLHGLFRAPHGSIRFRLDSAVIAGAGLDTVSAVLALRGWRAGNLLLAVATNRAAGAMRGGARLEGALAGDTVRVTLDTLAVAVNDHTWRLAAPAHAVHDPGGDALDSLWLRAGGASFAVRGVLPRAGDAQGLVRVDSLPLADLGAIAQSANPLGGFVSGELRVSGTRVAPVMQLESHFRAARYGVLALPYLTLGADYAAHRLALRLDIFDRGQAAASAVLALPADLALVPAADRFPNEPLTGRLRADSVDLGVLSSMTALVSQPTGTASADIALTGTYRRPLLTGRLAITRGEIGLPRLGIRLRALETDMRFAPDGVRIAALSVRSGSAPDNFMSLTGSLLAPSLLALWDDRRALAVDLETRARSFQVVDSRRLARIEVTDSVTLRGPFESLVLRGRLAVDKADFYLSDLSRKNNVVDLDDPDLFQDPAFAASRPERITIPPDISEAIRNLQVDNLDVTIGDKVWLRSEESEIKLGGAVQITGSGSQRLTGRIDVQRGAYRLDLGLVQRTFQVDSGSVSFYGDADKLGELDIWASNTVRQANRLGEDVKILAHITGTTGSPHAEFSSGERYALSETEILSYLVFGQPSFLGGNDPASTGALRPVAQALLPSLGTVMERALTSQVRWVDQITIQTGAASQQNDPNAQTGSALFGSRLGIGKQIGERTYVAANAGLCWLSSSSSASTSFSQSLGLSLQHRISQRFFVQGSLEPSSAALLCKPGATDIGSRPQQYGLDLYREWSF